MSEHYDRCLHKLNDLKIEIAHDRVNYDNISAQVCLGRWNEAFDIILDVRNPTKGTHHSEVNYTRITGSCD